MNVESIVVFALVLLYFAFLLDKTFCTIFSTNQKFNQNQLLLACLHFAVLDANY